MLMCYAGSISLDAVVGRRTLLTILKIFIPQHYAHRQNKADRTTIKRSRGRAFATRFCLQCVSSVPHLLWLKRYILAENCLNPCPGGSTPLTGGGNYLLEKVGRKLKYKTGGNKQHFKAFHRTVGPTQKSEVFDVR